MVFSMSYRMFEIQRLCKYPGLDVALNLLRLAPLPNFIVDRKYLCRVLAEAAFQRMRHFLQRNFFIAAALNKSVDEASQQTL